ncbi:hypothetical protein B9Z55_005577 [Caenorhabditis nigoni]|nr:hypothetical protein B9Z55_005577 [Caenorhabditis nigoni]
MFPCLDTIFLFSFTRRGVSTTFPIFLFSNSFLCQLFFFLFRQVPSTTLDVAAKIDEWLQSWHLGGPGKAPRLATGPKWPLSLCSVGGSFVC